MLHFLIELGGNKMGEIAKELRITDSTVDREEKKTLRFFREILAKKNIVLADVVL